MTSSWGTAARTKEAKFLIENLDLDAATGEEAAVWNEMALAQINASSASILTVDNKCRQGGWSFNEAALAVAVACLQPRSTTIFVSYSQEESKEKIVYAKRIVEALHPAVRPGMPAASTEELGLENGSRLKSLPCREPRGTGRPRVVLDEFAFYGPRDADIFRAAVGALGRGGVIRIGSTPRPAGLFRSLADPSQADPSQADLITKLIKSVKPVVREWPWWYFAHLAKDLASARANAPHMRTEERVERYGTERLHLLWSQYAGIGDLGGFQQEYECTFVAEMSALIGWSWIRGAQIDYELGHVPIGGVTTIGADFARQQDQTCFVVVHFDAGFHRIVDAQWMRGADAHEQAARLVSLAGKYKPYKVYGDVTDGYGRSVMEMARIECPHIEDVSFTIPAKEEMIARTCGAFFNKRIAIPAGERMLADDIASVRRVQKPSGHVKYESPRNSKGHADSFWALALAIYACPASVGAGGFEYRGIPRTQDWAAPEGRARVEFDSTGATIGAYDDDDGPRHDRAWGDW